MLECIIATPSSLDRYLARESSAVNTQLLGPWFTITILGDGHYHYHYPWSTVLGSGTVADNVDVNVPATCGSKYKALKVPDKWKYQTTIARAPQGLPLSSPALAAALLL